MPLFRYRAVDEAGQVVEGEIDAADRSAAVDRLRRQGRLVVMAEPAGATLVPAGLAAVLGRDLLKPRAPSDREMALMLRELATLLKAGLPLDRALEVIAQLSGSSAAGRVAGALLQRVRGGAQLAEAMEAQGPAFKRFAVGMVRAGEAAGALEVVVSRLAEFQERTLALKDQVVSALIYPLLLLAAAIATVVMLLTVVLPQFRPLFEEAGRDLPLPTQVVMAAGELAEAWWWLLPVGLMAVLAVLARRQSDPALRLALDRRALAVPVLGRLVAEIEVARVLRGLGTLLANGVPLLTALSILRETVGNAAVGEALEHAAASLKEGRGLAEPLGRRPWFPPVAARLVAVGEETGRLDDMVARAADLLDGRAQRLIERGLALLGPVMTLGLGLLVAGIIAAILLAILRVNDLAL